MHPSREGRVYTASTTTPILQSESGNACFVSFLASYGLKTNSSVRKPQLKERALETFRVEGSVFHTADEVKGHRPIFASYLATGL